MPDNLWGELAQMGERRPCKAEVAGSNPAFSMQEKLGVMLMGMILKIP